MKKLFLLNLLVLTSCAQYRGPASQNGSPVAYDTIALGNVKASAIKTIEDQNVCFDVTVVMKGVDQKEAQASNWTLAWVDKQSQYHLLSLSQREPASVPKGGTKVAPYGAYEEWTNTFRTCAPQVRMNDVKSLVLTPKELSYKESESMKLEWN